MIPGSVIAAAIKVIMLIAKRIAYVAFIAFIDY
jgi:hypothetical protein